MQLRFTGCLLAVVTLFTAGQVQTQAQEKTTSFAQATGITVTVAEMAGATTKQPDGTPPKDLYLPGYPDLWIMELEYKPIRMVRVDVTDPVTKKTQRELVWYMVYRGIRRDYTTYFTDTTKDELIRKLRDPALQPVNEEDPAVPPMLAPHFTLVTTDEGSQKIYNDWVLPDVQKYIARREGLTLRSAVQAIQPVPPLADDPADQEVVQGVAIWRNVDPQTDYFSVFMSGFSNGYRIGKGPNGERMVERKTIVQKFWRPGDQFDQEEQEVRIQGKPEWIYRPEAWSVKWPAAVQTPVEELLITRPDAEPSEILKQGLGGGDN